MLTSSAGCGWACWTGRWRAIDWWVERTRPPTGGFVITGSARGILPYGPSLVSAARDLFSFVSAGEGPPQATAEEAPLDSRVKGIEDAVLGLRGGLEALREELQHRNLGGPADAQNLAGPSRGPARPKAKGAIPGLDAAVLASARAAGIPEEQLVKMGELASRAGKLGDGARAKASILSESEEEDVPGAGGAEESSPGNVSEAICKMTAILSQLARSRKPGSLEDLLDRGESAEAGSSGSLSGGSSKAAAYQKLSTLLRDDPGKIASSVLKLMSEDFSCHRSAPGLDGVTMTARGWLEHRSRVQQYMGPVRWGWQTAGALDSLLEGRVEECKARLCLMLCALDQSSLDLAQEMHLEPSPPIASFAKHRAPEAGEEHRTKIMDTRWVSLPEAREPNFMKFNSGNPQLPHLPGAGASPVHGGAVWSTFFSVLGRAKTPLSRFWHSLRSASPGYSPGQPGRPWPMPVPYPGLHKPGGRRGDRDVPRKLALNATVLVLSWLYLGQPGALSQPGPLALGSTLSKEQWAIVGTLERNTEAWNSQPLVGPADMGRSAAKVESCEEILRALEVRAASVASTTDRRPTGAAQAEFLASESYGTLGIEPCVLAQPIKADRLRFLGRPEFDPMPFLDKGSREVYQHPLRFARELPPEEQVPRTQVRCSRSEALKLLHVLDASGRLALRPASATRPRLYNGLFAIAKDLERDRMILDARGPNQVESTEQPWLRSMASVEQLQWLAAESG